MRWVQDFYQFQENELATLELVTDSAIEVAQVAIHGSPRRIPDSDRYSFPSLKVLGPDVFPGN